MPSPPPEFVADRLGSDSGHHNPTVSTAQTPSLF
jgi:hypothetical protein